MITPIHLVFNIGIYSFIHKMGIVDVSGADLLFLFSAELIDLDHLLSRPIYHPRRNPFVTHIAHKNWPFLFFASIFFMFYRPIMFLGVGLLSHLFGDYCYIKIYRLKS